MTAKRTPAPAKPATDPSATSAATPPAETSAPPATEPVTPPTDAAAPPASEALSQPAEPDAATAPSEEPDADELVDVRVLVAFEGNSPNDVIALPRDEALALEEQGQVDGHPAAVAYARSLQD